MGGRAFLFSAVVTALRRLQPRAATIDTTLSVSLAEAALVKSLARGQPLQFFVGSWKDAEFRLERAPPGNVPVDVWIVPCEVGDAHARVIVRVRQSRFAFVFGAFVVSCVSLFPLALVVASISASLDRPGLGSILVACLAVLVATPVCWMVAQSLLGFVDWRLRTMARPVEDLLRTVFPLATPPPEALGPYR
jgi:hypothetical protein